MPELPEVESVRRQLEPELSGRRCWPSGPTPSGASTPPACSWVGPLRGSAAGASSLCPLDQGLELILHLGMTGVLHFGAPDAYARARITLDDGRELVFRDVRRFGGLAVVEAGALRVAADPGPALGPEPLSDEFDPHRFARDLAATRAPVKPYLLSQRPVAGVGNIYADEALWLSRIHPASRRVGPDGPWPFTAPSAGS